MTHDVDAVTDRLALRHHGFPYPRNSVGWSGLRMGVSMQRLWHAIRPVLRTLAGPRNRKLGK